MVKKWLLGGGARREKKLELAEGLFRIESSAFFILGGETGLKVWQWSVSTGDTNPEITEGDFKSFYFCLLLDFGKSAPGHYMLFFLSSSPLTSCCHFKHSDSLVWWERKFSQVSGMGLKPIFTTQSFTDNQSQPLWLPSMDLQKYCRKAKSTFMVYLAVGKKLQLH